jgi:hypothetical protein
VPTVRAEAKEAEWLSAGPVTLLVSTVLIEVKDEFGVVQRKQRVDKSSSEDNLPRAEHSYCVIGATATLYIEKSQLIQAEGVGFVLQ